MSTTEQQDKPNFGELTDEQLRALGGSRPAKELALREHARVAAGHREPDGQTDAERAARRMRAATRGRDQSGSWERMAAQASAALASDAERADPLVLATVRAQTEAARAERLAHERLVEDLASAMPRSPVPAARPRTNPGDPWTRLAERADRAITADARPSEDPWTAGDPDDLRTELARDGATIVRRESIADQRHQPDPSRPVRGRI